MSFFQRRSVPVVGLLAFLATLPFGAGCSKMDETTIWPDKPGKRVLVSFPPLYCWTQNVAGDDANVLCLMTGTDPHDYSVSYQDAIKLRKADLFLCNGLELENRYLDKLVKDAGRDKSMVVRLGDKLPHDEMLHTEEEEHPKGKDDKHDHEHGEHDPHVWLSPKLAILMVDQIAGSLSRKDPAHRAGFETRAADYKKKLQELQEHGVAAFKGKLSKKIVTQHDSLRYFARDFGLDIVGNIRLQSGVENDPKGMADLIQKCKNEKVSVITVEPNYPVSEAKNLQGTLRSQGVETTLVEVDPLETAPGNPNPEPEHYLKTMKKNIDNLAKALQ